MDALTRDTTELQVKRRTRRWPMLLACLALLAAIVAVIWLWQPGTTQQAARNRADQAVPVVDAAVTQKNVPIYLDGLGTVQAFNTVTMKPMVDGPLTAVDFKEGQEVHKGEVLAQIDPRTYQAALDQALAKKAADEALLANARLDYVRYQKLVANKYTSAQQADTAKSQVAQYQAQVQLLHVRMSFKVLLNELVGLNSERFKQLADVLFSLGWFLSHLSSLGG